MLDDAITEGLAVGATGEASKIGWAPELMRQVKLRVVCTAILMIHLLLTASAW